MGFGKADIEKEGAGDRTVEVLDSHVNVGLREPAFGSKDVAIANMFGSNDRIGVGIDVLYACKDRLIAQVIEERNQALIVIVEYIVRVLEMCEPPHAVTTGRHPCHQRRPRW